MTTCPPAPLKSSGGPTIVVASLMRSGTHLLLDTLFNNYSEFRRFPLFVDFDAYARKELPLEPLSSLRGVLIKTHYPETPLPSAYADALAAIASRSIVLTPTRNQDEVRTSLTKWGVDCTSNDFADIKTQFENFWTPFSPTLIPFTQLLDATGIQSVLLQLNQLTGLNCRRLHSPVMPANLRLGVYIDKLLTRLAGSKAPRINTTIGYRLSEKKTSRMANRGAVQAGR